MTSEPARQPIVWVGYTDGKPDVETTSDVLGAMSRVATFTRRDDARRRYRDVRKMMLIPVAARKGGAQ
jgi:hypothetical protein